MLSERGKEKHVTKLHAVIPRKISCNPTPRNPIAGTPTSMTAHCLVRELCSIGLRWLVFDEVSLAFPALDFPGHFLHPMSDIHNASGMTGADPWDLLGPW